MRRATRPAIWTIAMAPPSCGSMRIALRSLSSLALSGPAFTNLPAPEASFPTPPPVRPRVHMDAEAVEEDADATHRRGAEAEPGGRHRRRDAEDAAIGGAHHQAGAARRHPPGIAEEIGAP